LGLGIEFDQHFQQAIAAVTTEAAQAVAERYFIEPYVSVVGSEAAIEQLTASIAP
jgi:zinc protease